MRITQDPVNATPISTTLGGRTLYLMSASSIAGLLFVSLSLYSFSIICLKIENRYAIGQSKCPGETLTSRRESRVEMIQVLSRCGPTKNQICHESEHPPSRAAGVIRSRHSEPLHPLLVSRMSFIFHTVAITLTVYVCVIYDGFDMYCVSGDEVYYTPLGLSQRFDIFHRNAYEDSGAGMCGPPLQRSGLQVIELLSAGFAEEDSVQSAHRARCLSQ